MNLAVMFARCAERQASKTAICWGDLEISYAALLATVKHLASRLQKEFNVKPGDRVALWVKNCPEFVPAVFGSLSAGGVVVPINNFLKPAEVSYILNDSGANVLITDADLAGHFPELSAARPSLKMLKVEEFAGQDATASRPTGSEIVNLKSQILNQTESDLAALLYTSGTTGHPKGAMLTHGNFLHNIASCVAALEVREDERVVVALPQFHSFMFTVGTLLPMTCGAGIYS
jgi:long-chain acyl-CoA synthetase